jgi:membrane protease YdiL (CAAX protease family)
MTDNTAATVPAPADVASGKPWGVWATIAWSAAAIGSLFFVGLALNRLPLPENLNLFLGWVAPLAVVVIAVLVRRLSVSRYLAWNLPRPTDVLVAVGAALLMIAGQIALAYLLSGGASLGLSDTGYRHYLDGGGSPAGFILSWYPAYIYAPIGEETVYRGFLWRGLAASRLGNWGALLLTSVLFAAPHIFRNASQPQNLIPIGIAGLIFGLVRWRTGSTTACMITHSLMNFWSAVSPVLAAAYGLP